MTEFKLTKVLPYINGLFEQLCRCLQQQGVRTVFKSETTLRSHLVQQKDPANPTKMDGVVYRIPGECSKVYIGETGTSMQDRKKEHDRDIWLSHTQTSAISEHAHNTRHYPLRDEVKFIYFLTTSWPEYCSHVDKWVPFGENARQNDFSLGIRHTKLNWEVSTTTTLWIEQTNKKVSQSGRQAGRQTDRDRQIDRQRER